MPGPKWYFNRLLRMSPQEVGFRIARAGSTWWQRLTWDAKTVAPFSIVAPRDQYWATSILRAAGSPGLNAAKAILSGQFRLLGLDGIEQAWPPSWNRDPKSGVTGPSAFGKSIDYRDASIAGDPKYVWELNRHLEFPLLAQAYRQTGEEQYLRAVEDGLESWMDQCPFPLGLNWCSSLECAIRLINWAMTWQILEGALFSESQNDRRQQRFFLCIEQHMLFIQKNYSGYSSANNHLIGEAAGIYVANQTWDFGRVGAKWAQDAKTILIDETAKQFFEDGVGKEQTIGYIPFVLEFLLSSAAASRSTEDTFPPQFWQRIHAAMSFLESMFDSRGNFANFGDNDDGAVLRLWGYDFAQRVAGLRQLLSGLDTHDQRPELGGENSSAAIDDGPLRTFDRGGYLVYRAANANGEELHCALDCAPLGYLATAAHGHADALSLTLTADGHRILIDPGTYAYHTEREWRDYFRSTAAHNTVTIDELDQSTIAGSFMWSHKAKARCEEIEVAESHCAITVVHDGYQKLSDPVIHRRKLEIFSDLSRIRVTDWLICNNKHTIQLHWHLGPECEVTPSAELMTVTCDNAVSATFRTTAKTPLSAQVLRGCTDTPGGWYSDRFDRKFPTNTIRLSGTIERSSQITTDIEVCRNRASNACSN